MRASCASSVPFSPAGRSSRLPTWRCPTRSERPSTRTRRRRPGSRGGSYPGRWAIGEDSGLEVEGLYGAPGIRSARFAGDGASDEDNVAKLLAALREIDAEGRRARYVSELVVLRRTEHELRGTGTLEGAIATRAAWNGRVRLRPGFRPRGREQHRRRARRRLEARSQPPRRGGARPGGRGRRSAAGVVGSARALPPRHEGRGSRAGAALPRRCPSMSSGSSRRRPKISRSRRARSLTREGRPGASSSSSSTARSRSRRTGRRSGGWARATSSARSRSSTRIRRGRRR